MAFFPGCFFYENLLTPLLSSSELVSDYAWYLSSLSQLTESACIIVSTKDLSEDYD